MGTAIIAYNQNGVPLNRTLAGIEITHILEDLLSTVFEIMTVPVWREYSKTGAV